MAKYYDTHAHTNLAPLLAQVDNIVNECKKQEIIFNVIGTNYEDSLIAIKQAKQYPDIIKATIGFHPSNINNVNQLKWLENLYIEHKKQIVAIGEIGLDYHYDGYNKSLQIEAFKYQIELANKYDLPIVVHVRDAHDNCLEILKNAKTNVLIHCFSASKDIANKYLERKYWLSFGGITTFKNAQNLLEIIKFMSLDKLVLETDCPWLAPVPFRGQINKPYYVKHVFNFINEKLKISNLQQQVLQNSLAFFGWNKK